MAQGKKILFETFGVGRVSFLEMCPESARLSTAIASHGMTVGAPCAVQTDHSVWTAAGKARFRQRVNLQTPSLLWMTLDPGMEALESYCYDLATLQHQHRRLFVIQGLCTMPRGTPYHQHKVDLCVRGLRGGIYPEADAENGYLDH